MDIFKEEFNRCARCFLLFCEDNSDEEGNLDKAVVDEALEGFIKNIEIAHKISTGEIEPEKR